MKYKSKIEPPDISLITDRYNFVTLNRITPSPFMYLPENYSAARKDLEVDGLDCMELVNRYQETKDGRFIVEALQRVEGKQLHLSRLIYQHIKDGELRMDFVQDLFLKLCKVLKTNPIEKNCKGWFYRLVSYELINFNNRADNRRRSETVPDIPDRASETGIEALIDQKDLLRDMENFLGSEEWQYIQLFHLDRYSYRECAEILEVGIGSFRGRLDRIRKKVVQHFRNR